MRKLILLAVAAMAAFGGTTQAAVTAFNTDASFLAAAGGGLGFESFETATAAGTTVTFPGGTFACSGASYCPGFFGVSSTFADHGARSVFFASPDTATFTFTSAITAFGIAIGGAGDVAPITLTALLNNGDSAVALNNHSGPFSVFGQDRQYFGVISDTPFTAITFSANNRDDGIFFDSMSYGRAQGNVPEPGTLALLGLSLVTAVGFGRRAAKR